MDSVPSLPPGATGWTFDHQTGWVTGVKFDHDTFDYISLEIDMVGDVHASTPVDDTGRVVGPPTFNRSPSGKVEVYVSSLFCPFRDLLAFLEAIAVGVQECSFSWEAEGPSGRFEWQRSAKESGALRIDWSARSASFDWTFYLDRRQFVGSVYRGFRDFVESARYNPFDYEEVTLMRAIEYSLQGSTAAEVARELSCLDAPAAAHGLEVVHRLVCSSSQPNRRWRIEDLRAQLGPPAHPVPDDPFPWQDWDGWDRAAREAGLLARFAEFKTGGWEGAPLRALRSDLLERWLEGPRRGVAGGTAAGPSPCTAPPAPQERIGDGNAPGRPAWGS